MSLSGGKEGWSRRNQVGNREVRFPLMPFRILHNTEGPLLGFPTLELLDPARVADVVGWKVSLEQPGSDGGHGSAREA